jgi:hypothetical protein
LAVTAMRPGLAAQHGHPRSAGLATKVGAWLAPQLLAAAALLGAPATTRLLSWQVAGAPPVTVYCSSSRRCSH